VSTHDKTYQSVQPLRRLKFISPRLLATRGNRLIAGREFTWTDTYQRRPVAMVSENLARELWQDPRLAIGRQMMRISRLRRVASKSSEGKVLQPFIRRFNVALCPPTILGQNKL
jgi:hypothetical protein